MIACGLLLFDWEFRVLEGAYFFLTPIGPI